MVIKNLTRKTTISPNAKIAKSFKDKSVGLIFEKEKKSLVLTTRFGIHTHLMKKPIDILILDEAKRVVKMKENLPPNRIFLWNPKYKTVIELPNKLIKKTRTRVGDKISFTK